MSQHLDSMPSRSEVSALTDNLMHYKTIGSFTTESELATALDTEIASMPNYSNISIRFNFTTLDGAFRVYYYYGTLTRAGSSSSGKMQVYSSSSTVNARIVIGSKSTTWIFREIANANDVDNALLQDVNMSRMSILSVKTFTLNVPNATQHLLLVTSNNNAICYCGFVYTTSGGTVATIDIHKGSAVTIDTSTNNRLVYTISDSNNRNFYIKDISMGTTTAGRITLVTS